MKKLILITALLTSTSCFAFELQDLIGDLGVGLGGAAGHVLCKDKSDDEQALCSGAGAAGVALFGGGNAEDAIVTGVSSAAGSKLTGSALGAGGGAALGHHIDKNIQKSRNSPYKVVDLNDGRNGYVIPVPALDSIVVVADFVVPNDAKPMTEKQVKRAQLDSANLQIEIKRLQNNLLDQMNDGQIMDKNGAATELQSYINFYMNKYSQMAETQHINTRPAVQKIVNALQVGVTALKDL